MPYVHHTPAQSLRRHASRQARRIEVDGRARDRLTAEPVEASATGYATGQRQVAEEGDHERDQDADGRVGMDFGIHAVPETFVIDAQGRVRYRHLGPVTQQVWEDKIMPVVRAVQ